MRTTRPLKRAPIRSIAHPGPSRIRAWRTTWRKHSARLWLQSHPLFAVTRANTISPWEHNCPACSWQPASPICAASRTLRPRSRDHPFGRKAVCSNYITKESMTTEDSQDPLKKEKMPISPLPKAYDFKSTEKRIYAWWEQNGYFKPSNDPNRPGFDPTHKPFVISIPPPNVTGELHLGHAMFVSMEDLMIRYQRMKGIPTLWVPGTDHAGIATQLQVEKTLAKED